MSARGPDRLETPRRATLPAVTVLTDRALERDGEIEVVVRARVARSRVVDGLVRYELEAIEAEVRWDAPAC